jgi:virulence-associated protein VapD
MEAAEDLAYKCQRQSCEPGILHTLGLAQLQDKQVESAKKTYQDIKRYLEKDKKLRAEVIQDLQSLKNKNLDLISTLDTIITTLN